MNLYTKKALGGLLVGLATTGLKHLCTNNKSPIATGKNLKENFLNRDTFNLVASTIPSIFIKSTPIGLFGSLVVSVLMNCINKPSNNDTNDGNTNNLETKHASIISTIKTYANQWTDNKDADGKNARFGGKNFWDNNTELLGKMGLNAENFYENYEMPDDVRPEAFHDGFMYPEDKEKIFDVIADYNPTVRHLYEKLYKSRLSQEKKNDLKGNIISGVACKFTLEDIEEFCTKGYKNDGDYPDNIQKMNGCTEKIDNGMSYGQQSGVEKILWKNGTYLGQHNWSPCDRVERKIEEYLKSNPDLPE